ncbi:MAG: sulfatase-like hydrolase/transferase [Armatimonadota bacterium]
MADQPNILLIVSDQHARDIMGCAGDEVVRTPNLDALAARGVRFENAYCGSPLCVPSRMTMLTGRHCSDIGVWSNSCYLGSDIATFAHSLGAAGYETVLCGRMHFIGPDQRHGFHRRIIGDVTGYTQLGGGPGTGLTTELAAATGQSYPAVATSGAGRTAYQAYDEAVGARAQQFLIERDSDQPLLLVAGFVLPHCPFVARKELFAYYHERVPMPEIPDGYLERMPEPMKHWREVRGVTGLTEEQIRCARAAYYGMVEHFDEIVGGVLAALAHSPLGSNTVVIYVSDHGESAGRNGLWWKSNFYEHSVGVPMILAGPGVAEGQTRSQVVSLLDLAPTLTELGGGPELPLVSGQSLLPLLRSAPPAHWRDEALAELIGLGPQYEHPARMIRRGPWKLVHYEAYEPMLFNLEEDPGEFEDRAADPQCRDVRSYLHDRLLSGWDPERAQRAMRRSRMGAGAIRAFAQRLPREYYAEDAWSPPEDCNTWPE